MNREQRSLHNIYPIVTPLEYMRCVMDAVPHPSHSIPDGRQCDGYCSSFVTPHISRHETQGVYEVCDGHCSSYVALHISHGAV